MEDITDADYTHLKRIYKDFQWKTWGKFLDLYVQSNTFLLVDVFESFRKMCLETNEFMASRFKKDKGKIRFFNWHWDGRKKILEEEYVSLFTNMQKLIIDTWKDMIEIKNLHIFNIGKSFTWLGNVANASSK